MRAASLCLSMILWCSVAHSQEERVEQASSRAVRHMLLLQPKVLWGVLNDTIKLLEDFEPAQKDISQLRIYRERLAALLNLTAWRELEPLDVELEMVDRNAKYQMPVWYECSGNENEVGCIILDMTDPLNKQGLGIWRGIEPIMENTESGRRNAAYAALAKAYGDWVVSFKNTSASPVRFYFKAVPPMRTKPSTLPVYDFHFGKIESALPYLARYDIETIKGMIYWTRRALGEQWRLGATIDKDPMQKSSLIDVFVGAKVQGKVQGALLKTDHEQVLRKEWEQAIKNESKVRLIGDLFIAHIQYPIFATEFLQHHKLQEEYSEQDFLDPNATIDLNRKAGWSKWRKAHPKLLAKQHVEAVLDSRYCLTIDSKRLNICGAKIGNYVQFKTKAGLWNIPAVGSVLVTHGSDGWYYTYENYPLVPVPLLDTSLDAKLTWVVIRLSTELPSHVWNHVMVFLTPRGLFEIAKGLFKHAALSAIGLGWVLEADYVYRIIVHDVPDVIGYLVRLWTAENEAELVALSNDAGRKIGGIVGNTALLELANKVFEKAEQEETSHDQREKERATKKGADTLPSLDELSAAAGVVGVGENKFKGNNRTVAGRALEKHNGRPGSAFPKVKGSATQINEAAQQIVDDILTSPGAITTKRLDARFGQIIDIVSPNGRGVRYDAKGKFMGFLEPKPKP